MAVYKRTYHGYDGPLTGGRWRFLVLPRYTFEEMRKNKRLFNFFMASFAWPLIAMFLIYLNHNASLLRLFKMTSSQLLTIDTRFFLLFLGVQSMLGFFIAAFAGPSLVAPDLANNALPLYLARPFSRAEYVLGKASVLMIMLSLITWIPGLVLFLLESNLSGMNWMWINGRIVVGVFFGAWVWILVLTSMCLAFSAWVRMKHLGSVAIFVTFFGSAAFGGAANLILNTHWGSLLDISHSVGTIWVWLFGEQIRGGAGAVFFAVSRTGTTPLWTCVFALIALCAFCMYLLNQKIRGTEVVQ
jgi:ABC-2 type transport system permease protein